MNAKTISISAGGIEIPVLGFGCSALTGTSRKDALRLLETAFESGVRHFDVARYYGHGDAEGILGAFAKSRRAEITITTKFGLQPPKRTSAKRFVLQAGRKFVRLFPSARNALQRESRVLVTSGRFSAADARISLETSLRELATDYVDFFLLHDYIVGDLAPVELVQFLKDMVKAGKIRNFGMGTGFDQVLHAWTPQPELCGVIQFENSVLVRNTERLPPVPQGRLVINHGALSRSYRAISAFMERRPHAARKWSAELGVDCSDHDNLAALMLNYAVESNARGLVLFSSTNATRVARNVKAVLDPTLSPAQVSLFGRLIRSEEAQSEQLRIV